MIAHIFVQVDTEVYVRVQLQDTVDLSGSSYCTELGTKVFSMCQGPAILYCVLSTAILYSILSTAILYSVLSTAILYSVLSTAILYCVLSTATVYFGLASCSQNQLPNLAARVVKVIGSWSPGVAC